MEKYTKLSEEKEDPKTLNNTNNKPKNFSDLTLKSSFKGLQKAVKDVKTMSKIIRIMEGIPHIFSLINQ